MRSYDEITEEIIFLKNANLNKKFKKKNIIMHNIFVAVCTILAFIAAGGFIGTIIAIIIALETGNLTILLINFSIFAVSMLSITIFGTILEIAEKPKGKRK